MQTEIEALRIKLEDQNTELEFLRYFYNEAGYAMGPADAEIYQMIKDDYDGVVPKSYCDEVGEEDADT